MKKTILVSAERGETRVAVLESKTKGGKPKVAELYIERRGRRSIVGNIYKGKVVKVPLKSKGARLSMNVSIAGRYLVFAPQGSGVGVSRRLSDSERDRLRKMVDRTYKGPGGLIVRTAAHGAKKSDFVREISYLQRLNEVLQRRTEEAKAPALVFQEADLSIRVLRDVFLSEFEKAIIDSQKQFERVTAFFQRTAPELVDGVELYREKKPLF